MTKNDEALKRLIKYANVLSERDWNYQRKQREKQVLKAVKELSEFMGCNKFHLPMDGFDIKVNYKE